jgi:hypothetical protein
MHPKQSALEKRLRAMLDELDNYLEDTYGECFDLHPNRLARGEASSTLYDGLFSASLKFTMGYGTDSGRGYSVVIDISTLESIDRKTRNEIDEAAAEKLSQLLPRYFPERDLRLAREGHYYKIIGDFSLGDV